MIERREREGEREKDRYKERYREGGRDKRERERESERERERERWKARRVNPTLRLMLSPNYGMHACKKGRGTRTVPSLRGKSSGIMSENYPWIISGNYHWELWEKESERERERAREGWKARRVNPTLRLMPSQNYGTSACKKGRGTRTVHSLRRKSSGIIFWELSSENYILRIILWELYYENYLLRIIFWELSSENYDLVKYDIIWRRKVEIYRDTGVSKNKKNKQVIVRYLFKLNFSQSKEENL